MKIKFDFQYVPDGQMEPDKYNRWAVAVYIYVPKNILPQYKFLPEIPICVAIIHQRGMSNMSIHHHYKFQSQILSFSDINNP